MAANDGEKPSAEAALASRHAGGAANGERRPDPAAHAAELQQALAAERQEVESLRRRLEELEGRRQRSHDALLRYRELFEFAPDAYLVTDLAGSIRECNYAASRLFRTPKEFLIGKPLPFYCRGDEQRDFYNRLIRLRTLHENAHSWEACLTPRREAPVHVALTVTVYLDEEGRPDGLRWMIRDIGPRKAAEDALRAENSFVESLIDAAQAVVLLADADGRLLRTNAHLEAVSGFSRDELLGMSWLDLLLDPAHRREALSLCAQAGRLGVSVRATFPLRTRDGGRRGVAWAARPVRDAQGGPSTVVVVGHDITELQEAQERALRAERLATIGQVSTGLAHESRNILQRSQACLERLTWRLKDQPEPLELVVRVQKAQEDLLRLYEDVRGYASPIQVHPAPCVLAEVWREAWADLTSLPPQRDARLVEETAGTTTTCEADRFRVGQVFRNLLENALAACPDPVRIVVSCQEARLGGRPALRVAVRDNGPGLTPEGQRRLFEPFYTTKAKGTGLGMAISRRIVEAHGGQIAVGDDGPGAEIVVTLPREKA